MGYLFRRGGSRPKRETGWFGRLERVDTPLYCDMGRCPDLAAWRIGYGAQSVDFCPKHTLSTMRNKRIWKGVQ